MKRILPIFLAVMLLFSGLTVCVAAEEESFDVIKTVLAQLNVMNGDPDGSFRPYDNVTRAEFAKIAIMASSYRDFVASGMNTSPFSDVSFTHWAAPYIKVASANKIVTGYPDSKYRPESYVLMEEAVTVAVKLLGYTDADFAASWPYGQIGVAQNIGILDNIGTGMGDYYTREDVAKLIYNVLRTKPKNGSASAEYINSLGYSFVENVTILATSQQDSMVPTGKVSTSNGTYKINDYFDQDIVGESGDVMINTDSNELVLFFGKYVTTEDYVFSSVIDGNIIAYKDGELVSLKLADNLSTYYELSSQQLGSVKSKLKEGSILSIAYDAFGNVEYLTVNKGEGTEKIQSLTEEEYIFYSVLDNEILAYKDGKMVTLKLSDKTPAYYREQSTTLGSVKNQIDEGYLLAVSYDMYGDVKYVRVDDGKKLSFVNDVTEKNYSIYSVINGEIMAYKDGKLISLKLPDDLTVYNEDKTTNYGAVKASLGTGYFLAVGYDSANNAKYARVVEEKMSGPVVVMAGFAPSSYSLSSNPTVMRDGNKSSASEIAKYDVVYYSQALDTVWAYSKKVSGTFEAASPSRDNVTSVTIAGKTYNIETADASIALSSSGDFVLGDTITVLLGKNGEIAGVVEPGDASSVVYGYLIGVGTSVFKDNDGNETTSKYVEILQTDGSTMKVKTTKDYSGLLNSPVKITLNNKIATVELYESSKGIQGVVDANEMTIGDSHVADNVNVIEVGSIDDSEPACYKKTFFKRLDGLKLSSKNVRYYKKNKGGEITDLILYNVTGDAYKYGIVTKYPSSGKTGNCSGIIGVNGSFSTAATSLATLGCPVQIFVSTNNSVHSITPLTKITDKVVSVSATEIATNKKTYKMSDECVAYNGEYNVVSLEEALVDTTKKLEFYVDKYSNTVRVIKVMKK